MQRSANLVEVRAVLAEVIGEFVGPTRAIPVVPGLPSIEEPLWIEALVLGLSFEPMPCIKAACRLSHAQRASA